MSTRQHCRLSICENWLSWTNTETAAATPPTVMQNLLRASAQWLVLESAVFWLICPPTWVNWHMKLFLVHFIHYSGAESGNFSIIFEFLVTTSPSNSGKHSYWSAQNIGPMRASPRIWEVCGTFLKFGVKLPLVEYYVQTNRNASPNLRETVMLSKEPSLQLCGHFWGGCDGAKWKFVSPLQSIHTQEG